MIVVSDTSPFINLFVINEHEILGKLYRKIIIPMAVYSEIAFSGYGKPGSKELDRISWVEKRSVKSNFVYD